MAAIMECLEEGCSVEALSALDRKLADEGCMTAIMECLEEGCSVEALSALDRKLAEDESRIASSLDALSVQQKTAFTEENIGTMAWLRNFINRSQGLRGQLRAMRGIQDHDFVQQLVRA